MPSLRALALTALTLLPACGTNVPPDASVPLDGSARDTVVRDTPPEDTADSGLVNGCPSLIEPVAQPGDPAGGDTWQTFARTFFATYCTHCHGSDRPTLLERNGAPIGLDFDVEAIVRANTARIRRATGVRNYMPIGPPDVTCDERLRLVRWIDVGAP